MLQQNQLLIDRYQLANCLADKTGRQTWKAIDRQTNQPVVLKVLLFGTGIQWQEIKLFEREAALLRSLDLPQIPRYLDDFELDLPDAKGFVLVQSYLDARSLEFYLESGYTFTQTEVKEVAQQILQLLMQLHDRTVPIIHRDIKPSNLLISDRSAHSIGKVYLVDFGSAMTYELSGKGTVTIVGTFGYIPPEQFVGRTVAASDLYSLGITLISLLIGMSDDALSHNAGQIDLESLAEIDLGLTRWLQKMTEPTLERRFCSAKEALAALNKTGEIAFSDTKHSPPANTKIVLKKSIDRFSVQIPRQQFSFYKLLNCSFFPVWFSLSLSAFLFLFGYMAMPLLYLLIVVACLYLPYLWINFLFSWLGSDRLTLTPTQIKLTYFLLGIPIWFRSSSRKDVVKLEHIRSHYRIQMLSNSETPVPDKIVVWAGTKPYELLCKTALELEWLAEELSNWLELPIEQRDLQITKN